MCHQSRVFSSLGPHIDRSKHLLTHLKRIFNGSQHLILIPGHGSMDVHIVGVMVAGDPGGYLQVSYDLPCFPQGLVRG